MNFNSVELTSVERLCPADFMYFFKVKAVVASVVTQPPQMRTLLMLYIGMAKCPSFYGFFTPNDDGTFSAKTTDGETLTVAGVIFKNNERLLPADCVA
ncbi:MAG: hypothetical protein LBB38_02355 [Puniceicoccales bacterium]|nr:hypothetical protein [Puniceicoccales bacterium]